MRADQNGSLSQRGTPPISFRGLLLALSGSAAFDREAQGLSLFDCTGFMRGPSLGVSR